MKWPQPRKKKVQEEEIDEHSQPTEPMARLVLPAYPPTVPQVSPSLEEPTIAAQPLPQAPLIQQQALVLPGISQPQQSPPLQYPQQPPAPVQVYSPYPPSPGAYPVLPVSPTQPLPNNPPVGGDMLGAGRAQPQGVPAQRQESGKQRRLRQPLYVGMFFVAVQVLLLGRFVTNLLSLPADNVWRDIIVTFSDVFLLPFYLLFRQVTLPVTVGAELYTLLAVLIYGMISRILVRLLKTVLRAQQARTA